MSYFCYSVKGNPNRGIIHICLLKSSETCVRSKFKVANVKYILFKFYITSLKEIFTFYNKKITNT